MVNNKNPAVSGSDIPRRRGRPAGKNRIPLSQEERRARNAQYERERREQTADAMTDLIEAAHCDPDISNAELLATVIDRIQRASRKSDDISDLMRINANLESQIKTLQGRLGLDDEASALLDADDTIDVLQSMETVEPQSSSNSKYKAQNYFNDKVEEKGKKRKRFDCPETNQPDKRFKALLETNTATQSECIPSMESLAGSLLEVPSKIQLPHRTQVALASDCHEVTELNLADPENIELPSDFHEVTIDILTDSDTRLLSDWVANYSGENISAEYSY